MFTNPTNDRNIQSIQHVNKDYPTTTPQTLEMEYQDNGNYKKKD